MGAAPLFLKIQTKSRLGLIPRGLNAFLTAAPDIAGGMLGHRDSNLLGNIRGLMPAEILRGVVQPRPFVLSVFEPSCRIGPGPRLTPCEGRQNLFRQAFAGCQNERFPLPLEPQVSEPPQLVNILVKRGDDIFVIAVVVSDKCKFWHFPAFAL